MPSDTKSHRLLRLILFLSGGYPKTREECTAFLGIRDSAFFNYRNVLLDTGFCLVQKDGRYRIEYPEGDHHLLGNILHFSEEESYLLARSIDRLEEKPQASLRLKQKLTAFLNQNEVIGAYLQKEKKAMAEMLFKACRAKKQVLLVNYASGNSQTIRNRMVEPFEFRDDFSLLWAFDTELKQNRQFKICRIEDVESTSLSWEYERDHRASPVDVFRNTGEMNKLVEFSLNLKARNLLIEEYPLTERFLTKTGSGRFHFQAAVAKYEGPARFVMGLYEDIEVLGDPGFGEFLGRKIKKLQNSPATARNVE
jgi:predicted DNA-binding transcriptional regulator YafY